MSFILKDNINQTRGKLQLFRRIKCEKLKEKAVAYNRESNTVCPLIIGLKIIHCLKWLLLKNSLLFEILHQMHILPQYQKKKAIQGSYGSHWELWRELLHGFAAFEKSGRAWPIFLCTFWRLQSPQDHSSVMWLPEGLMAAWEHTTYLCSLYSLRKLSKNGHASMSPKMTSVSSMSHMSWVPYHCFILWRALG